MYVSLFHVPYFGNKVHLQSGATTVFDAAQVRSALLAHRERTKVHAAEQAVSTALRECEEAKARLLAEAKVTTKGPLSTRALSPPQPFVLNTCTCFLPRLKSRPTSLSRHSALPILSDVGRIFGCDRFSRHELNNRRAGPANKPILWQVAIIYYTALSQGKLSISL